jgi:hypothetical protein
VSLRTQHEEYVAMMTRWMLCRDVHEGEDAVKVRDNGHTYLPPTFGQKVQGADPNNANLSPGQVQYNAYKTRARMHNFFRRAVETCIGFLWTKNATYELPAGMQDMLESATAQHETLQQLHLNIHWELLKTGRVGLHLDLPAGEVLGLPHPRVSLYTAESVHNWHNNEQTGALDLVVLNESFKTMDWSTFERTEQEKYRVLWLNPQTGQYEVGVFLSQDFDATGMQPSVKLQGVVPTQIPFVFINALHTQSCVHPPLLLDLAHCDIGIYRLEADYRQTLYLQAMSTLFHRGLKTEPNKPLLLGPGGELVGQHEWSDAKFVGVQDSGLSELRQAIANDKAEAGRLAGELVDDRSMDKESAAALNKKQGSQNSRLVQVAKQSAAGLQQILRLAALWRNQDPTKVVVTPNLTFVDEKLDGATLSAIMGAKVMGLPISLESMHQLLQKYNLTDLSFEEELAKIAAEGPLPGSDTQEDEDEDSTESSQSEE